MSRGGLAPPASAARASAVVSMCPAAAIIGLFCFLFVQSVRGTWTRQQSADLLAADRTSSGSDFLMPSENRMEPLFDPKTPRNITIASGKTAYLPCRVRHLGERTVSSEDIDFVDARITVDADLRDAVHQIHALTPPALLSLALHNERAPRSVCLSFPARVLHVIFLCAPLRNLVCGIVLRPLGRGRLLERFQCRFCCKPHHCVRLCGERALNFWAQRHGKRWIRAWCTERGHESGSP